LISTESKYIGKITYTISPEDITETAEGCEGTFRVTISVELQGNYQLRYIFENSDGNINYISSNDFELKPNQGRTLYFSNLHNFPWENSNFDWNDIWK
jgi:hypothetical protein